MKLKLLVEKQFDSAAIEGNVLIEKQYLCPCKISKVIFLAEIEPSYSVVDEDILCSQCRDVFDIVPNTQASQLIKKGESSIDPRLFPKRRKNGLKSQNRIYKKGI